MKAEDRKAVFADLRKIFDGRLVKEFGTTEVVPAWEGRITFVAAVTPAIDRHISVIQSLGERFIQVRWHRAGPEAARRAMNQDIEVARAELKAAVHALFHSLLNGQLEIPSDIENRLVDLAELVVRARTHVERGPDKSILADPEPESPTRLVADAVQKAFTAKSNRVAHPRGRTGK